MSIEHLVGLSRRSAKLAFSRTRLLVWATVLAVVCAVGSVTPAVATEQHTVWTKRTSGVTSDLTSACFIDTKNVWAVGRDQTVIRSKDGGVTWTSVQTPVIAEPPAVVHFDGVDFADDKVGWVVGWIETPQQPTGKRYAAVILKTTDGGVTWTRQTHPDGVDRWMSEVVAFDTMHAYAVSGVDTSYGSTGKNMIHTDDGGATWQVEAYAPAGNLFGFWGWRPNDFVRQYVAVGFPNIAADNFEVGLAWETANPLSAYPQALLLAIDEGTTWSNTTGERTFIAVGDTAPSAESTGVILRATELMDANWELIPAPTPARLRSVSSANLHGDWWIVGTGGTVFHSHGGTAWTTQANPAGSVDIWDVDVSAIDGKQIGTTGDRYRGDDYLVAVGAGGLVMTGERPRVALSTPVTPATVRKKVAFTVTGSVTPAHTGATTPLDFECYVPAQRRWVRAGRVLAKNTHTASRTTYRASFKPQVAGRWRVCAVHLEHYEHRFARSPYRYFTVK